MKYGKFEVKSLKASSTTVRANTKVRANIKVRARTNLRANTRMKLSDSNNFKACIFSKLPEIRLKLAKAAIPVYPVHVKELVNDWVDEDTGMDFVHFDNETKDYKVTNDWNEAIKAATNISKVSIIIPPEWNLTFNSILHDGSTVFLGVI